MPSGDRSGAEVATRPTPSRMLRPAAVLSGSGECPQFRGALHRWSVPFAVAMSVWLVARARGADVKAGMAVYGLCIVTMLTVSGIYHLPQLSGALRTALRRADHSTILLAIAGSYTGVIVAGMSGTTRTVLLVGTWVVAAIGIGLRLFWFHCPTYVVGLVYVGAGWSVLLNPGAYLRALDGQEIALLVAGGLLYLVGAGALALRWPDPWPRTFGYHEVFHTFVVLAALSNWIALYLLVTR